MDRDIDIRQTAAPARGSARGTPLSHNERLVLGLLRTAGPQPKAEVARQTGLSAQTVSVIMRQLEHDGLLQREAPLRGRVGQPSVPMALAADGALFLGLKIGRRSTDLVLTDFLGQVVGRQRHTYGHPSPEATVAFTRDAILRLTGDLPAPARSRVAGLGVAMPFQIWYWATGPEAEPRAMDAWRDFDIRAALAAATDIPVYLQNDGSSACGAEMVFGTAATPRNFLYFYVAYFVGGGIVLNGSLFTGDSGNAAALGSMPVSAADGTRRQLIDVASLAGFDARLSAAGHATEWLWGDPEDWQAPPEILGAWIADAAEGLAQAIAAAICVVDFDLVMIDGWIPAGVRDALTDATRTALDRIDHAGVPAPTLQPGTIGPDARALGAASLALADQFLVDRNSSGGRAD